MVGLSRGLPTQEARGQSLGQEDALEEETATSSSILAWRIPRTEVGYSPQGRKESDKTEHTGMQTVC